MATTTTATFPAMRWTWSTMSYVLLSAVLILVPHTSLACSPIESKNYSETPSLIYKTFNSPVVVSGEPIKMYDHQSIPTLYNVDFQVQCVVKGEEINQVIRINNVGYASGICIATDLTLGNKYLVYLDPTDTPDEFTQLYIQDSGEYAYVQDVVYVCGATSKYPTGVTKETAKFRCPGPNDLPSDCSRPSETEGMIQPPPDVSPFSPTSEGKVEPPPGGKIEPPPGGEVESPPDETKDPKPDEKGAVYKPVVDDSSKNDNNKNSDNDNNNGDKDAATIVSGTWALMVTAVLAIFQLA